MKRSAWIAAAMAALLLATAAEADNGKDNNGKDNKGKDNGVSQSDKGGKTLSDDAACPPGLAKKDPPCVPPGQAQSGAPDPLAVQRYLIGQALPQDFVIILDPRNFPNWTDGLLAIFGGNLYRIDRDGDRVLDLLGPVDDWQWHWNDVDFKNCPPGLAKKNPPCVPPGQAKKMGTDPFRIGDHLPDGHIVALDPGAFGRDDNVYYVRFGDTLYRIDRGSDKILTVIGPVSDFGN